MAFSPVGALNWMRTANQNYREDKLARENLIARREDALLSLYIKNGGEYKNTKTGKTYNDAAKNALLLQDRVNNHLEDTNDPDLLEVFDLRKSGEAMTNHYVSRLPITEDPD